MRLSRLVPVLAAGALFAASTSPAQAQTDPVEGVGTTVGALSLLGLDAGDLLTLDLLTDAGSANIDEDAGPRRAAAQIAALAIESPATGISQTLPLLQVESTGAPDERSQALTPIDNPIVSGVLTPLQLSALVEEGGATSLLSAGLADLEVLSGILTLAGTTLDLGSTALVGDAAGSRGVDVDALTLLDLEALLAALGIPLTDLPLDSLLGLIDGLGLLGQLDALLAPLGLDIDGLSVDGILDLVDDVLDEVTPLLAQVDALTGQLLQLDGALDGLGALDGPVTETCTAVIQPVLGLLPGTGSLIDVCTSNPVATITGQVTSLEGTLATVRATLDPLLDQVQAALDAPLELLSGQALLSLEGLDVTVLTKATDDVATSVAEVTGTLGSLQVGELPVLGTLDLTAPTGQLNGLLAQAEGLVGGILGEISPALADLVSIRSMQETTSVEEVAGSIVSSAAFTGLDIEVLPLLGELTGLLDGLGGDDSVGALLGDLGLSLPTLGAADVLQLNSLLAPITDGLPLLGALEDGLGLQVASLSQQSTFTPIAAQAPTTPGAPAAPAAPTAPASPAPTLPRTGSDDGLLLALAGAAVLAALGGRQLVRRNAAD